ncbi:uncharacterized protein BDZ99DRAFT_461188 [Mytilinidion resinicola]|uniref:Uncharacterized protein n=1 Tax=Mytilinidion resinicola TaxID=574789 RepID=A0A6A6YX02_9PEZI|nr:uncharacterized protein BDZ99DRAFT_461188 [Mytilinidion resinicola]KAF2812515.1 hypothetical protein BDZ99DRAFT_461188 [Mytilinidion resinicola]
MVGYVGHVGHALVRRGVQAASEGFKNGDGKPVEIKIPGWGQALLFTTFIVFTVILSSLEYTLKDVVATLAMVESPSAEIALTSPPEDADPLMKNDGNVEENAGPNVTLVRAKPITSKIRTTLRHLKSQAGPLSKWRGLVPFIFYNFTHAFVTKILDAVIPGFIPGRFFIFSSLSAVLLARVHAAWTHTVISMPSNKRFWRRMPPASSWRQLALPAAVKACAGYASLYVAVGFVYVLRLNRLNGNELATYKGVDWFLLALRVTSLVAVVLLSALFVTLPAIVTLVRVEASLLPEDSECIVPFDRSFAGKVVPAILGGSGAIGFVDAWRSFNWEARRRLVFLYVKITLVMFAVMIILMPIMVFEIWVVMGPALQKLVADAQGQVSAQGEMHTW